MKDKIKDNLPVDFSKAAATLGILPARTSIERTEEGVEVNFLQCVDFGEGVCGTLIQGMNLSCSRVNFLFLNANVCCLRIQHGPTSHFSRFDDCIEF